MGLMDAIRDIFAEANEEFVKNVSIAWDELKTDMKSVSQARFLRLGAILRRKQSPGVWQYGIYLGFQNVLTTDDEGTVICYDSFEDFCDGEKLYVATENHIALGGHRFIKQALLLQEKPPVDISSKELVLACLEQTDSSTVATAIRKAHGDFQWLEFVPLPTEEEDEDDMTKDDSCGQNAINENNDVDIADCHV